MTDSTLGSDFHHLDLAGAPAEARVLPSALAASSAHAAGPRSADAARVRSDAIGLEVHRDLAEAGPAWEAFESGASHTFFQTFAWLEAWQHNVGTRNGTSPAIVFGTHPDGTLLFILPLAIQRRHAIRELTFLGSNLCDYNAPLLHPRFAEQVTGPDFALLWTRIVALLRGDGRFRFDVIDLSKMPETVGGQANPLLALSTEPNPSGAYLTELGASWDDLYAAKRSPATRKTERKQLRKLGEAGEIRFVDDLEGEERAKTLDLLFTQKARSFERMGVRNIFARPGFRELFTAFATAPGSRHLVHLSRLEVGLKIVAVSIGFTACSCYYLVLSSYDGGELARLGPGRAHLHELLKYAIGNGFSIFDFTIGDEAYKQDWSDRRLTLHDHLSAVTGKGGVAVAVITRFRTTKRAIKQNPAIWRQFSRARAAFGAFRSRRTSTPAAGGPGGQDD